MPCAVPRVTSDILRRIAWASGSTSCDSAPNWLKIWASSAESGVSLTQHDAVRKVAWCCRLSQRIKSR